MEDWEEVGDFCLLLAKGEGDEEVVRFTVSVGQDWKGMWYVTSSMPFDNSSPTKGFRLRDDALKAAYEFASEMNEL